MRLYLLTFILFVNYSYSQNLILNGDFEDINICSEYNAPCSPEAWRLTSTLHPAIYGNSKNHYSEIVIHNSSVKNIREYLQSKLGDKLKIGKKYKISFQIKPGDLLINSLGVVFSDTLILDRSGFLLKNQAQIEFADDNLLKLNRKNKDWITLTHEFIAKTKANYIIIGCFVSDSDLKYKYLKNSFKEYSNYRYYIDNIELIPIDTQHDSLTIEITKKDIYSQDSRHPIPDRLFKTNKESIVNQYFYSDIELIDTIVLYNDLLFEFDSYEPTKRLKSVIDSIFLNQKERIDQIKVIGHTDSIGTNTYNDELSLNRAEAVKKYISSLNIIEENKILFKGVGSKKPIDSNKTKSGREKNRRVEILINYRIIR